MGLQKQKSLQLHTISYKAGDRELLCNISFTLLCRNRVALVGINGSGKSTLLKIAGGLLDGYTGSVFTEGSVQYVPQIDLDVYKTDQLVRDYISTRQDSWWEVMDLIRRWFDIGFTENSILSTLSGGELVKLNLCIALAAKPDFLLLDEPTNHLDMKSLSQLMRLMQDYDGGVIVVSHNRSFLNQVSEETWELKDGKLSVYGGNYDFYRDQKRLEEEGTLRRYEAEQKQLRKAERALQKENIRFQESQAKLTRMARENDRSMPKIVRNAIKPRGQTQHGKNKLKYDKSIEHIEARLQDLKPVKRKNIHLDLPDSRESGLIIRIGNGTLRLPNKRVLLSGIGFELYFGDRVVLSGNNGSGKTTFVKAIAKLDGEGIEKEMISLDGEIKRGDKKPQFVFIDQKYDIINPEMSLLENISSSNPSLDHESIRRFLSDLGFHEEGITRRPASTLSGGEIARLAFAIATSRATNVLILDEPTNNLDIETVETIARALKNHKGTIVVVSHDVSFLKEIGIEKGYKIDKLKLSRMQNVPQDEESFIEEISDLD